MTRYFCWQLDFANRWRPVLEKMGEIIGIIDAALSEGDRHD